jgi:hypothetical protein
MHEELPRHDVGSHSFQLRSPLGGEAYIKSPSWPSPDHEYHVKACPRPKRNTVTVPTHSRWSSYTTALRHTRAVDVKLNAFRAPFLDRYEWSDTGPCRFDFPYTRIWNSVYGSVGFVGSTWAAQRRIEWEDDNERWWDYDLEWGGSVLRNSATSIRIPCHGAIRMTHLRDTQYQ